MKLKVIRAKIYYKVFLGNKYLANLYRMGVGFGHGEIKDVEWVINRAQYSIDKGFSFPPKSYPTIKAALSAIEKVL